MYALLPSPTCLFLPCLTTRNPISPAPPPKLITKPVQSRTIALSSYPTTTPPSHHHDDHHHHHHHRTLPLDWPQLLQLSIASEDLRLGLTIHGFLLKTSTHLAPFQGNNLINMYSKFHHLDDARRVLEKMPLTNTISWTSLMSGYLKAGDFARVQLTAQQMHRSGETLNGHTCTVVLQSCRTRKELVVAEQIHGMAIKIGADSNVVVGTSLFAMYSRNGLLEDAELVFGEMAETDVHCLNSLILEYGKAGDGKKAVRTFGYMLGSGLEPDDYTFTNTVSVCNGDEGRQLHCLAIKYGVICELSVGNAVITMYGRHGFVEEAKKTFHGMEERSLVSWTAMLSACLRQGDVDSVIDGFREMILTGMGCDFSCLATVLDACSENRDLSLVSQIHSSMMKLGGYLSDVFAGTALVDAYAKCGSLEEARQVFDRVTSMNIASFNAILAGYMEAVGPQDDAMLLFSQLRMSGMGPADEVTVSRLLKISADYSSLIRGESLHAYSIKAGMEKEITVGNALISMYAKCGSIGDALHKFTEMDMHDLVTWNAMISAHALHGQGEKSLLLFEGMVQKGMQTDETTLVSILQGCVYAGLLEEGVQIFKSMEEKYGIKPQLEHHVCMVDLLGRFGDLAEAMEFVRGCQFKDSPLLWRTLVSVCKFRSDLNFGLLASRHLLNLAPDDAASYILVSSMYSQCGRLEEAAKVRVAMNDGDLRKEAGCSWIEVNGKVHRFTASGGVHMRSREIYSALNGLNRELKNTVLSR